MWKNLFYALVCVPLGMLTGKAGAVEKRAQATEHRTAHDFTFTAITGEELPLMRFKGKPVLVVNTASECGFTMQYKELQQLHERYGARGLVVLAVPSDDFGGQEPGSNADIKDFCQLRYGVDFYLAAKERVKGEAAHPFYRWAQQEKGALAAPKWNFHKYLIAPDGTLAEWFATPTSPLSGKVTSAIEALLPSDQPQP